MLAETQSECPNHRIPLRASDVWRLGITGLHPYGASGEAEEVPLFGGEKGTSNADPGPECAAGSRSGGSVQKYHHTVAAGVSDAERIDVQTTRVRHEGRCPY